MTWGFFSMAHILSLLFGVAMIAALYFLLRGKSDRVKVAVLTVLSFFGHCRHRVQFAGLEFAAGIFALASFLAQCAGFARCGLDAQ